MQEIWKTYNLLDFIDINPRMKFDYNKEYSFVEMKDLDPNSRKVLPSEVKKLKGGAKFQNEDTLFARITPCLENGKICQVQGLVNNIGFGSTEFLVFRGKKNVSDNNFVYYLSREPFVRQFAESNMIGTSGRQRVAKEAFKNLVLNLPPIAEQKAIAQILSAIDEKMENNLAINKTLEDMAMALYKHWFVDFGPFQDGVFVESELGLIPEGWKVDFLESLFLLQRGFDLPQKDRINGSVPVYAASGKSTFHNEVKVQGPGVTTGRSGVIGNVYFINEDFWPLNTSLWIKKFINSSPYHAYFVLKNINLKEYNSGSAVPTLNRNDVHRIQVIKPSINIVNDFDKVIKTYFNMIENNTQEIQSLTQLRDTLLPKLISGDVRLKEFSEQIEKLI